MCAIGCGGKKPAAPKKVPEAKPLKPQLIKAGPGSNLATGTKKEPLWKVAWSTTIVKVTENGADMTGDMSGVSGVIFKGSKAVCTFSAQRGSGDKTKQVLILTGGVKLIATNPDSTMFCDRMEYDAKLKLVKASGKIRVLGTADTEGTIDELWATPDLKKLATPDMFYRQ